MTTTRWVFASASRIGSSHQRFDGINQDRARAFCVQNLSGENVFVGMVADGAGSASMAHAGSILVCRTLTVCAREFFRSHSRSPCEEEIVTWIETARNQLLTFAERRQLTLRDLACTLVMALAESDCLTTIHIGDGAVVAKKKDESYWQIVSAPESGEYSSTTFFVTDFPKPRIRIARIRMVAALALFTDGIEHFVLSSSDHKPSSAFFDWVCKPLEESQRPSRDPEASRGLSLFLESDQVMKRTDDDRSLIVCLKK